MNIIMALLIASQVQAGFISRICEKFICDAPYEPKDYDTETLKRHFVKLGIKIRWNKASHEDRVKYGRIQDELKIRLCGD